jgi:hypothetical protein
VDPTREAISSYRSICSVKYLKQSHALMVQMPLGARRATAIGVRSHLIKEVLPLWRFAARAN